MNILRARWWCLCLMCLFVGPLKTCGGYQQLPTFDELVSNAMYINHQPTPAAPEQLNLSDSRQLLLTFMNFTCNGTIIKLTYVGWITGWLGYLQGHGSVIDTNRLTAWPYFSLWYQQLHGDYIEKIIIGPSDRSLLSITVVGSIGTNTLVEVNLTTNVVFKTGDILGVRLQQSRRDIQPPILRNYSLSPSVYDSLSLGVLKQTGGYGLTLVCGGQNHDPCSETSDKIQEIPFITVETVPHQQCAVGFLHRNSSEMIVQKISSPAPTYLNFLGIPRLSTRIPLTRCGPLRKIFVAAKYNVTVPDGWPKLEIIRRANNGSPCIAFSTNTTEPKPTGYLNVYEYDLSAKSFIIQPGDALNISWYGDTLQSDRIRFSLAYDNYGMHPMVSFVANNNSDSSIYDSLGQPDLYHYCEEVTDHEPVANGTALPKTTLATDRSDSEAKSPKTNNITVVISGVMSSLLLSLLLIIIIVVICVFVRRNRREKSFSINTADSTEMNRRVYEARPFQDATRNMNSESGPPSEKFNDYISDDRVPSGAHVQASTVVHDSSNQQDDYYYYKLYEWGVFVPTADQRGNVASSGTNNNDAVYSTLGESQYSKLQQFNKAPEFFENSANYWKPAANTEGLYQQLSSKKYREILRQQIRLSDSLGSGQFGNVMKGVWLLSGGSKEVAVKMLKEGASEIEKVRFLQEAAINGQFWHPNVVKLMGVVTIGEPAMVVLELLPNGDLRGYLMKMQPTPGEMVPSNTPHILLRFCKEIAAGMKYLAGKGFVHRDLAARNILVSEEKTCKIGDFGMSRDLENDSYYISHGGMIPVKWTAPEALHYKKYSTASDVWSFGCVMYEIWSLGHKPFEEHSKQEVIRKVDGGFRLPPPPGCPRDVYHIMMQCWHPKKNLRPSFSDLHTSLSDHALSLGMNTESPVAEGQRYQPLPLPLHPQAHVIGALLEAGKALHSDLQKTYIDE